MEEVKLGNDYVDYDACVQMMDDDIREHLHATLTLPVFAQEFLDAYCDLHRVKFSKEFEI